MDRRKIDMNFNGKRTSGLTKRLYRKHLDALENPTSKVDNHPPTLAVACYYNGARLASERHNLARIEIENRMLLKLINEIYRTKGKVDTSTPSLKRSTNYYERIFTNRQIEKQNFKLYNLLQTARPTMTKAYLDKEYKNNMKKIMFQSRYTDYYSSLVPDLERWDICPPDPHDRLLCDVRKRVRCYMDVAIDEPRTSPNKLIKLGRLYIEVYRDYAPVAADNFLNFIKGYNGKTYKGTQFFRIRKCIGCIGGDVECNDGGGYYGIGEKCFPDENHLLRFNGPGVISTFTLFPGHNHSHFFISFQRLDPMNGKFVVFGRLIKTLGALERIEECGTLSGAPKQKVVVSDCGFLGNYNFQPAVSIPHDTSPEDTRKSIENGKTQAPSPVEQSQLMEQTKSILSQTNNTITVPPNTMNTEPVNVP